QVAVINVPDENQARALAEHLRAGQTDFFTTAATCFAMSARRGLGAQANFFRSMQRRATPAAVRERLFSAAAGQIVGPVAFENGSALVRILATAPAKLDEETRTAIKDILFDEWLAQRRSAARIDWYWGNASKTD